MALITGRRHPFMARLVAVSMAAVASVACTPDADPAAAPPVVIAVGDTVEQRVLAALTAVSLDAHGHDVVVRNEVGGTVELRRELRAGRVDVAWDYTGAAWSLGLGQQAPPTDPTESFDRVEEGDRALGLTWLGPTAADATLAMFVRGTDAEQADALTMTWLARVLSSGEWSLCVDPDYRDGAAGLAALADEYTIDRARLDPRIVAADEEAAIAGVAARRCFAGLGTATSGQARNAGLVPVVDDRRIFPAFVVAPVLRSEVVEERPEVADVLEEVVTLLDTESLAELNAAVERGAEPEDVAAAFLAEILPAPAD